MAQTAMMPDGYTIRYQIDGHPSQEAPLVILSNPSLVDWTIWDEFIALFFSAATPANKQYRFLRYETRGRRDGGGQRPLTLSILSDDVLSLLTHLGVSRAAAMIGISLGGMTALHLALHHPGHIAAFVPCDFFPANPPGNGAAWASRVALAENDVEAPVNDSGHRLVGADLAASNVARWLSPKSFDGGAKEAALVPWLRKMVYDNALDGFKSIVHAIADYDLTTGLGAAAAPCAFVVGADDIPVVVSMMKEFVPGYGVQSGVPATMHIIPDAGHIPVVEQPAAFAIVVAEFLQSVQAKQGQ